jgi:hypothetical protein
MVNSMIDTITLIGKGIFLIMMFSALVLFGMAAAFPERFKVEDPTPLSFKDLLIELAPKYGIPPELAVSIAKAESNFKRDAIRFEPGQLKRVTKYTKNEHQQKMLASSHCAMQVMGYHAIEKQLSWADLYQDEICAEVGLAILKNCMDRHKSQSKAKQIKKALECYNGSSRYAESVFENLTESLIEGRL